MTEVYGRTPLPSQPLLPHRPVQVRSQPDALDGRRCLRVRALDLAEVLGGPCSECVVVDRELRVLATSEALAERARDSRGGPTWRPLRQLLPELAAEVGETLERLFDPTGGGLRCLAGAAGDPRIRLVPLFGDDRELAGAAIVVNAGPAPARGSLPRTTLVGSSEALRQVMQAVENVAITNATVLIEGESGVGKELVARAIHERSRRAAGPMVAVNCAAIPRDLFESDFFGHARGAFTGAHAVRQGRLELANGGTLFLDEVAELPLEVQPKLLRVLQEREFERVGDSRLRRVDLRIVAATHRDLESEVHAGRFRQDLYYRLAVLPIWVPPLRERPEDILALAAHFVRTCSEAAGRDPPLVTEGQARILLDHDWPGNVRELHNVIERAVIQSPAGELHLEIAAPGRRTPRGGVRVARPFLTAAEMREYERDNIVAALTKTHGRVGGGGGAAELLGVPESTLRDRIAALGIRRP